MSDRVKGFTVVLAENLRDDDAEEVRKAIQQLRGVIGVTNVLAVPDDYFADTRLRSKVYGAVMAALYPATKEKL